MTDFSYRFKYTKAQFRKEREDGYVKLFHQNERLSSLKPKTLRSIAKILSIDLHKLTLKYADLYSSSIVKDRLGFDVTDRELKKIIAFCAMRQADPQPFSVEDWRQAEKIFSYLYETRLDYTKFSSDNKTLPKGKRKFTDVGGFTIMLKKITDVINEEMDMDGIRRYADKAFSLTAEALKAIESFYPPKFRKFLLSPNQIKNRINKTLPANTPSFRKKHLDFK